MNVTHPITKISGMGASQFYVPVHSETGVLNASQGVLITGARVEVSVVEVRSSPVRTVEPSTGLQPLPDITEGA
jgi:hypothetical protein